MIIQKDSPFRKLPVALDKRQLRMLSGIRYSIEMYDYSFQSLLTILKTVLEPNDLNENHYSSILGHAWSMVDSANRLRLLIENMPGLSKRNPNFQVQFRKLAIVEELRNPIQHLNTEINNSATHSIVEPVWGSLSWGRIISKDHFLARVYVLLPGSIESHSKFPIKNILGQTFTDTVDLIELSAYGKTISLSDTYKAILNLSKILEHSLEKAFSDKEQFSERLSADLLIILDVKAQLPAEGDKNLTNSEGV